MTNGGGPRGPGINGMGGPTCAMAADCIASSNETAVNIRKYFISRPHTHAVQKRDLVS